MLRQMKINWQTMKEDVYNVDYPDNKFFIYNNLAGE
jgi:hypothetical protein